MFKKNTAVTGFTFTLIDKEDGSAITSGTVNAFVTLDGGTQTSITATPAHEGNGQWSVNLSAGEMNGDIVGLLFTHTDALPASFTIRTSTVLTSETQNANIVEWRGSEPNVLADGRVDTRVGLMSANTVNATAIADNAITANKIANGAITTAKVAEPNDFKADVSGLATSTQITNLNDFDPATDTVTLADGAHGGSSASITLSDYSDFQGGGGATAEAIYNYFTDGTRADEFKANVSGLSTLTAEGVWTHAFRTLTDKEGYSLTAFQVAEIRNGLATTANINALNDISEADIYTYFTSDSREDAFKATGFSTFDHTTDGVIVTTNNDKTGYSLTQNFPSNFDTLLINDDGHVSRVTLVDTTTINTDMRGTDDALLASNYTAPPSATDIVNAVLGATLEGSLTVQQAMRINNAILNGETTVNSDTVTFKDSEGNDFATITYGDDGERLEFNLL